MDWWEKKFIIFAKLTYWKMRCLILSFLIFSISGAQAQNKAILKKITSEFEDNSKWLDGSVQIREDQATLQGLVQFNEKLQTLKFDKGESIEFLTPNNVMKFEFYDPDAQLQKTFISIDYPINEDFKRLDGFRHLSLADIQSTRSTPLFFELLSETKSFAVLRKKTPIDVIQPNNNNNNLPYTNPIDGNTYRGDDPRNPNRKKSEFSQEITVYFLDLNGNMFPFNRSTIIETKKSTKVVKDNFLGGMDYEKNQDIKLGDKFLERIMGSHFPVVYEYIKLNNLKSSNIEHLLKIIDYYKAREN
jgi:hypothetical protein